MADGISGNASAREGEKKAPAFLRVRVSSLAAFVFIALAAIGAAYIGGVMSGRNMAGEARKMSVSERSETVAETPPGPALDNAENGNILSAEELEFARALRNQKLAPREPEKTEVQAVREEPPSPPAVEKPDTAPASAQPAAAGSAGEISDYVFQLGAFRDELSADRLRQLLEGEGLRTRLVRGGKLYVVRVLLRGGPERVAEVFRAAEHLKLGAPLEISRKAVDNP